MTISLIGKLLIFISLLVIVNALENNDNKNDSNISDNDEIEILWGHKEIDDINVPLRFFLLGYNLMFIIIIIIIIIINY